MDLSLDLSAVVEEESFNEPAESNTHKVAILLLRKDGVGVCGMSELQKLVLHRQT